MIERANEFGASAAMPLNADIDNDERTAGEMLRQAREALGLDIGVVAAALKVRSQKIEALERNDIDALTDPVFARALAASMSRALRIDPAPVLARLPGAPPRAFDATQRPLGASFNTEMHRRNGSPLSRTLWTVVALLLVGAGAVVFLPPSAFDRIGATVAGWMPQQNGGAAIQPSAAVPETETAMLDGQLDASASEGASSTANTSAESLAASDTPVSAATGTAGTAGATGATAATAGTAIVSGTTPAAQDGMAASTTSATSATSTATAPAAVSGARPVPGSAGVSAVTSAKPDTSPERLAFTAREDVWISVTDGNGQSLLRRLVKAGESESVPLDGASPLSVVVGRASAVDVQMRGKAFDILAVAGSGGVARFEVKP